MENYKNDLFFDDISYADLFDDIQNKPPYYADVLTRWESGFEMTEKELQVCQKLLIYYPRIANRNFSHEEMILTIQKELSGSEFQDHKNPDRGLCLATLIFHLLKAGKQDEAFAAITELDLFFQDPTSESELVFHEKTMDAYSTIIGMIMDSPELLTCKPVYSIKNLPFPFHERNDYSCLQKRELALDFYNSQEYDKAIALYHELRITGFELPGTLVHMVRVELMRGDIEQARIHLYNAWRIHTKTPDYVLSRILFFIIMIIHLTEGMWSHFIAYLKHVVNNPDISMSWEMVTLMNKYKDRFSEEDFEFLSLMLAVITGEKAKEELRKFEAWRTAIESDPS
jgi:hypothetical protein